MEEGVEHCLAHHTCSISSSSCMPGCFRPPMVVFHGIVSLSWRGKCSQRVCQRQVTSVALTAYCHPPLFSSLFFPSRLGCYYVQLGIFLSFFPLLFSSVAQLFCFYISKALIKKIYFFYFFSYFKLIFFYVFRSF